MVEFGVYHLLGLFLNDPYGTESSIPYHDYQIVTK